MLMMDTEVSIRHDRTVSGKRLWHEESAKNKKNTHLEGAYNGKKGYYM